MIRSGRGAENGRGLLRPPGPPSMRRSALPDEPTRVLATRPDDPVAVARRLAEEDA
jgi:hypothetical protein